MFARVVRFTDVSPDRIAQLTQQVEESDGPPPGVEASGMQLLFDEEQGTAIFIGLFETEQKMRDANQVFEDMDASDTPGRRASVDQCEIRLERSAD